jgi:glutamate N-acetyltransferase / amino-acid N-acetyltransferase
MATAGPRGFLVHTTHAGVSDDGRDDLTVIVSETPAVCSAMFTRSRFAGPSVVLSRATAAEGRARGVVVIARNANVATGKEGTDNAVEVRQRVAERLGLDEDDLLIASTGVIGVQYPMPAVRATIDRLPSPLPGSDFGAAARAIMTTDTHPKIITVPCGDATIIGMAKGVGMLEPNMATMLAFFATDARLAGPDLDRSTR